MHVPDELVEKLHTQFYGALQALFEKHHAKHPEFKNAQLTLISKHAF